jgi:hypothetical protein
LLKIAKNYQNGSHFGNFGAKLEFIDSEIIANVIQN